jgi:hypothetical protein
MWPFTTKRHLRYSSLEAWFEGERLTDPLFKTASPEERDRRIAEYAELRRHLFAKHIKTLSAEEQRQFEQGTHPSQSHRYAERAEPFAGVLQGYLEDLGFISDVCLGWYHMDRIVLTAALETDPGERRSQLPWLFRGFEVKYHWPRGEALP